MAGARLAPPRRSGGREEGGRMLSAKYDDRDRAVRQHFQRFAAEHQSRDPAAAMGGHDDGVASFFAGGVDNRPIGVVMLDVYGLTGHIRRRRRCRCGGKIFFRQIG